MWTLLIILVLSTGPHHMEFGPYPNQHECWKGYASVFIKERIVMAACERKVSYAQRP